MNYRHAFHAGNFADVFKHLVLMRLLAKLAEKPAAFRVIDSHAGAGLYDLGAPESARGGEWAGGVGLFRAAELGEAAEALAAPYRMALAAAGIERNHYPGSPWLIRYGLREADRAAFNEPHAETFAALRRALPRDERLAFTAIDGYQAWNAQLPPRERRGLVLVDPPFEAGDEFARLALGMGRMARKWPTGMAAIWYPIKGRDGPRRLEAAVAEHGFAKALVLECHVADPAAEGPLGACGLLVLNPPFRLDEEMALLLPPLIRALGRGRGAGYRIEWLARA